MGGEPGVQSLELIQAASRQSQLIHSSRGGIDTIAQPLQIRNARPPEG